MRRREFLKTSALALTAASLSAPAPVEVRNGMPYRALGKTGVNVSLMCLGGFHIAFPKVTEEEAIRMMRMAVDEGVNFFDNAWHYNGGESERRMGKALKDGYRDKVFLMTKSMERTKEGAQKQLDESLARMEVDHVDLWQFHQLVTADDVRACYEDIIEVAEKAKEAGKIRFIGFTGHFTPKTHLEMLDRGYPFDTLQMPLGILDYHFRSFESAVLPKAVEKNMGVIAMKTCAGYPEHILDPGIATARECHRYVMSLPVSAICMGMQSVAELKENLETVKNFPPMTAEEKSEILNRETVKAAAADGAHEVYKTQWHRNAEA